jgi:hypothetical protein
MGNDRYAYTNNNPVNGIDPTGHWRDYPGEDTRYPISPRQPICNVPPLNDPTADIHGSYTTSILMNMSLIPEEDSPYEDNTSAELRNANAAPGGNVTAADGLGAINYTLSPYANAKILDSAIPNATATLYYDLYLNGKPSDTQVGLTSLAVQNNAGVPFYLRNIKVNGSSMYQNLKFEDGYTVYGLDIPLFELDFNNVDISLTFYSPYDGQNLSKGRSWMQFQVWFDGSSNSAN